MRLKNSNISAWLVAIILLLSCVVVVLSINEISYSQKSFVIQSAQIAKFACITAITLIVTTSITLFIYNKKKIQRNEFEKILGQYENIFTQSRDAFISTDFNLNIVSWNKGAEEMYGYTAKEAIGKRLFHLIKSEVTENNRIEVWRKLKANGFWKDIVQQHTSNKKNISALISISVIKNAESNTITGFTGICTDITFQKKAEEKIEQLALMVESSNDAIIVFNEKLEITNWNKGAERLYGYTAEETEGKIIPELLAKQPSTKFLEATLKNLTVGGYWKSEDVHYKKNDQQLNVFVSFSPFSWKNNQNIYVGIITDITEQKEVEKKLLDFNKVLEEKVEEKTAEMREIFDRVDWGFCAFNIKDEYIFINPKAAVLLHKNKEDVLGKNGWSVFPNVEEEFKAAYYKSVETQKTQYCEHYSQNLKIWIASYFFPSETGVSIYFRDITERKKMQEDMISMNAQLRTLSIHQEKIREEERKKMAGELHDELGQLITSIKIDAEWLNKKINAEETELKKRTQDIIQLSSETAKKVRHLAQALRPSILDDMGLIPALEWQFRDFKTRTGIDAEFHHSVDGILFNEEVSTQVFRIVQESLTNIIRHSKAKKVICDMTTHNNKLFVFIKDNGVGFDITEKRNTFGLLGIKERIKIVGGTFTINSGVGEGTESSLEIPISN